MAEQKAPRNGGAEACKARLRRAAVAVPASVVKAAVAMMRPKAAEVEWGARGRRRRSTV